MIEFETRTFTVGFTEESSFVCSMSEDSEFDVDFGEAVAGQYHGVYDVTPSQETQTLYTANKVLTRNVTVAPIPSNYGLITWDGSALTVS